MQYLLLLVALIAIVSAREEHEQGFNSGWNNGLSNGLNPGFNNGFNSGFPGFNNGATTTTRVIRSSSGLPYVRPFSPGGSTVIRTKRTIIGGQPFNNGFSNGFSNNGFTNTGFPTTTSRVTIRRNVVNPFHE